MNSPATPRKRRRGWLIALALLACAVIGIWLIQIFREQAGQRRLRAAMAAAASDMPDWEWGPHFASGSPAHQQNNVARDITDWMLQRGFTERTPRIARPQWVQEYEKWEAKIFTEGRNPVGLGLALYPQKSLPEPAVADLRAIFGQTTTQANLDLLRQWAQRPAGRYEYHPTDLSLLLLLPMAQKIREVANILAWDAIWHCDQGRNDLALLDVQTLAMLARAFGDDPITICQLIRMAVGNVGIKHMERILAQSSSVNAAQLVQLQAEYEAEAERPILLALARGDRAFLDRDMNLLATDAALRDKLKNSWLLNRSPPETPFAWLNPLVSKVWERFFLYPSAAGWPMERARALEFHNRFVELAKQPEEQWLRGCEKFNVNEASSTFLQSLMNGPWSMGSAQEKVTKALLKHRSQLRCAAAACASERFRMDTGRWPRDWNELSPKYLPRIPLDAFTQKPLLWKTLPDGIIFYSVGQNEKDDGGDVLETLEHGSPKDTGFRLWSPESRRQGVIPFPNQESD